MKHVRWFVHKVFQSQTWIFKSYSRITIKDFYIIVKQVPEMVAKRSKIYVSEKWLFNFPQN